MRGIRWKRNSWSKYTADEMNWNVIVTWLLYGRGPRGSTLPWNAVRKCVRRERSDGGLKNSLKNELTLTWEWEGKKKSTREKSSDTILLICQRTVTAVLLFTFFRRRRVSALICVREPSLARFHPIPRDRCAWKRKEIIDPFECELTSRDVLRHPYGE